MLPLGMAWGRPCVQVHSPALGWDQQTPRRERLLDVPSPPVPFPVPTVLFPESSLARWLPSAVTQLLYVIHMSHRFIFIITQPILCLSLAGTVVCHKLYSHSWKGSLLWVFDSLFGGRGWKSGSGSSCFLYHVNSMGGCQSYNMTFLNPQRRSCHFRSLVC